MTEGRKKIWIALAVVAGLILTAFSVLAVIDLVNFRSVRFYYADIRFKELSAETRKVRRGVFSAEGYTVRLVKDYFLGPLKYELRLSLPENVSLVRVYSLTNKGKEGLVADFNREFLRYVENDNEGCRWALEGLVRTLRVNSNVKRLYVLVAGQPPQVQAGNWDLSHPLMVRQVKER